MKSFNVNLHHTDASLTFGGSHGHSAGRELAASVKVDRDKLTSSIKALDSSDIGKDALILDLQEALKKQEVELTRLRKENDDLIFIEKKYTTFKKTVSYYSGMLYNVSQANIALPTTMSASLGLGMETIAQIQEQQSYLLNLIGGLKTFISVYDKEHGGEQTNSNFNVREGEGALLAADMMTASMTIADTMRTHNTVKAATITTKPMLFSFIPLPYGAELDAAVVFKFFLFAERRLLESSAHQDLHGVQVNDGTSISMCHTPEQDPTADQWFGRRTFITMLFVIDIYDER